jgi:hypothetical protein
MLVMQPTRSPQADLVSDFDERVLKAFAAQALAEAEESAFPARR